MDTQSNREVAGDSATYFKRDIEDFKEKIKTLEKANYGIQSNDKAYTRYQGKYSTNDTVDEFINVINTVSKGRNK